MQTLHRAIAEIRNLAVEEIDLVSGGSYCMTTSETVDASFCCQTYTANGQTYIATVQDDWSMNTTTGYGWD